MKTIHVFGDSHASSIHSHWGYIRIPNIIIKCNYLPGKLMYTFGRLGTNLLNIKNHGVKENDIVIFCFGEIDCRNHVHKHITIEKTYKIVIEEIANSYFEAIKNNVKHYNSVKTCIFNVIPPTRGFNVSAGHPYPFLGTDKERKLYYTYMNEKLKKLCQKNNYFYFDIYNESCDVEGFLKKEYSDGNVHLRNTTHSTQVIQKYLL